MPPYMHRTRDRVKSQWQQPWDWGWGRVKVKAVWMESGAQAWEANARGRAWRREENKGLVHSIQREHLNSPTQPHGAMWWGCGVVRQWAWWKLVGSTKGWQWLDGKCGNVAKVGSRSWGTAETRWLPGEAPRLTSSHPYLIFLKMARQIPPKI